MNISIAYKIPPNTLVFEFDIEKVEKTLDECARNNSHGKLKVRLLLDKNGDMLIEAQPITQPTEPLMVTLADQPVDNSNPFLYHKTTNRDIYAQFQKKFTRCLRCSSLE